MLSLAGSNLARENKLIIDRAEDYTSLPKISLVQNTSSTKHKYAIKKPILQNNTKPQADHISQIYTIPLACLNMRMMLRVLAFQTRTIPSSDPDINKFPLVPYVKQVTALLLKLRKL